jgi:hypothetical protein
MKVLKDLAVSGSISVGQFLQSSINTDKFLVSESGVVKFRSGSQLLGDIGAAASDHTHTFASLTSKPTTLSGYGITDAVNSATTITINGTTYDLSANRSWTITTSETDTLATVTGRGASTSTAIVINNTLAVGHSSHYDSAQFSLDVNGGLLVKNTGKTAQLILINANPAAGGNAGFVQHAVGGTINGAFASIQTYYGASIAAGTLQLQPSGGIVTIGGSTVFHAGNYTTYSPTLTGSGASGTWAINITGSAGSVAWANVTGRPTALSSFTNDLGNYGGWITGYTETSTLANVTARGNTTSTSISAANFQNAYQVLSLNNIKTPGLYNYDGGISGTQPLGTEWYNVRTIELGADSRYSQFVMPYSVDRIFYRRKSDAGFAAYVELYHTGNLPTIPTNNNQLTNGAGYITSYTETDTLASVTSRGASTSTAISLSGNLTMSGAGNSTSIIFGDASKRINVEGYWMMFKGHENEGFRWQTAGQDAVTYTTRMQLTSSALTVNGNTVLHASNYSSYALPLSGGTMTGALVNNTDGAVIIESNASENNNWLFKENSKTWGLFWFNRGSQSGQTIGGYTTVGAELMFMGGSSGIAMPSGWTGYIAGSNIAAMISNVNGYIYSASTIYAATSMVVGGNTVYHTGNLPTIPTNNNQLTNGANYITASSYVAGLNLQGLGNGSMNVNNGATAVYRNENGSGGNLNYAPVLHLGGGDTMWQIQGDYYNSSDLRWRAGYQGTWYSWRQILHDANYNSYSPTLTGTGASGTWGISITGNAATVGGYGVSGTVGANTVVIRDVNGYIYANYINSNVSETENPTINSFYTSNGDGWLRKSSLAHVRSQLGNYGSWITSSSLSSYLPLSGGTLTGNLYIQSGGNPTQFNLRGTNPELYVDAAYGGGTARLFINRGGTGNQATLHFSTGTTVTNGTAWNSSGAPMWTMGMTNTSQTSDFKLAYGDIYDANAVAFRIDTNRIAYFTNTPYVGANIIATQSWVASQGYSTSSQVTINYNNDSNSTYQLLWGSGNSVYGTAQVYVNPSSDIIYARGGYISPGNAWGTSDSAFFPNGISTAGGTNWIYGFTYIGNAPGNGAGHEFNANGSMRSTSSHRATIYYDDADTTYYVDPGSNGTRAAFLNGNIWISPKSESYGEGIAFLMPSQATWGGLRWVRGVSNFTGAWAFGYFGNESNDNIGFHSAGVNGWRLDHSWNMTVIGSVRAPIFYDSEDTAYYLNPAGGSRLRNLYVGDSGDDWSDPGGWGTQVRFSNGPHVKFVLHARSPGIEAGMYVHTPGSVYIGSYTSHDVSLMYAGTRKMGFNASYIYTDVYLEAAGSLRAPIFYDSNDTGYYLDPNGTSNLNKLSGQTMAYNDMNPMSANSPYAARYAGSTQYRNGTMGYGQVSFNEIFSNWGSGFIDSWSSPGNAPGGSSHYVGHQVAHYNYQNSYNVYGYQMVCAGEADNRFFWRSSWNTPRSWVEMIHSGNIGGQKVDGAMKLWAESHPSDYYVRVNWTGSHWYITSNHSSPVRVGYADSAGSAGSASSATSASYASYLPTAYVGGQQTNPQVYFNNGIGLKAAMTGAWSVWSDTLWINGYSGGDVKQMCALHTLRNGTPRMSISVQAHDATSYGAFYEFITEYNIASQTVSKLNPLSGDGNYKLAYTADGARTNAGEWGRAVMYYVPNGQTYGIRVDRADQADSLSGFDKTNPSFGAVYASNWFRNYGDSGLYNQDYGCHFRRNTSSSHGTWEIFGYNKAGYAGLNLIDPSGYWNNLMFESGNGGLYQQNGNGWLWYYHRGNTCFAMSTSTTSGSYRAYVGGSLYAEGDIVAYSDVRKKKDIVTIDEALEKVLQMRGVYYTKIYDDTSKIGTVDVNKRLTGVIAQEINEVLPEVVTYADDIDEYGVSYGNIVGVLIEAIKEQQGQIEGLKKQIEYLVENK